LAPVVELLALEQHPLLAGRLVGSANPAIRQIRSHRESAC
jgi:hypothetical protein